MIILISDLVLLVLPKKSENFYLIERIAMFSILPEFYGSGKKLVWWFKNIERATFSGVNFWSRLSAIKLLKLIKLQNN